MAIMTKEKEAKKSNKVVKKRGNYFKGVMAELKKVHWPNRKELGAYTAVVISIVAIVALLIWIADTLISFGLSALIK